LDIFTEATDINAIGRRFVEAVENTLADRMPAVIAVIAVTAVVAGLADQTFAEAAVERNPIGCRSLAVVVEPNAQKPVEAAEHILVGQNPAELVDRTAVEVVVGGRNPIVRQFLVAVAELAGHTELVVGYAPIDRRFLVEIVEQVAKSPAESAERIPIAPNLAATAGLAEQTSVGVVGYNPIGRQFLAVVAELVEHTELADQTLAGVVAPIGCRFLAEAVKSVEKNPAEVAGHIPSEPNLAVVADPTFAEVAVACNPTGLVGAAVSILVLAAMS
jgi:hypothetical protein